MNKTVLIKALFFIFSLFIFSSCDNLALIEEEDNLQKPETEIQLFTVTFNTMGGSSIEELKSVDGYFPQPENPVKNYWVFKGWYTTENFTSIWNFSGNKATENITLFAKWEFEKLDMVSMPENTSRTMVRYTTHNPDIIPTEIFTVGEFKIMSTEVHQDLWNAVMGIESNPSHFKSDNWGSEEDDIYLPVDNVSWYETIVFCNKLSIYSNLTPVYSINDKTNPEKWGKTPEQIDENWNLVHIDYTANGYRLPTSNEWEYAARDGNIFDINGFGWQKDWYVAGSGSNPAEVCWSIENSDDTTHPVGLYYIPDPSLQPGDPKGAKIPTALGLFDMSGNVWEWVWDLSSEHTGQRERRGGSYGNDLNGNYKVVDGVSKDFGSGASVHLPYSTTSNTPNFRHPSIGFRVALNIPGENPVPVLPTAPEVINADPEERKITISWDKTANTDSYELYYSKTDNSADATKVNSIITDVKFVLTELEPDTDYYIWLKSVNKDGASDFSKSVKTKTKQAFPDTPAAPQLLVEENTIKVSWKSVQNAISYNVYYSTGNNSNDASSLNNTITGTSAEITGLNEKTTYYVWIRGVNSKGMSNFSPSTSALTGNISPAAPAVTSSSSTINTLSITWDTVDFGKSYEIWYGTVNNIENAKRFGNPVTQTSTTITDLKDGTKYFVWVRAINGEAIGKYSTPQEIDTKIAPPAKPEGVKIESGDSSLKVSWNTVDKATSYEIWYNESTDSNSAIKYTTEPTNPEIILTGLTNDKKYFIWIKANKNDVSSEFSDFKPGIPRGVISNYLNNNHTQFMQRTSFASAVFDGKMHIHDGGAHGYANSQTGYYESSDGLTWSNVPFNNYPQGMAGHFMNVYNDKLYIIGYFGYHGTTIIDGVWSKGKDEWSRISESTPWRKNVNINNIGYQPHGIINFKDRMYAVIGNQQGSYSTTDGITWTHHLATEENKRLPYLKYATVYEFDGKLFISGGERATPPWYSDEIWSSTDGINWTKEGVMPEGRIGHTVEEFNGKLWMFNGRTNDSWCTNDVYYSSDGLNWIKYSGNVEWPARMNAQTMVFDDKIWIIGGDIGLFIQSKDVWAFKPE